MTKESNGDLKDIFSLSLFLSLVTLIITRITLLSHEFLGHAVTMMLLGAKVTGFYLFYFAGGYVDSDYASVLSQWDIALIHISGVGINFLLLSILSIIYLLLKDSLIKKILFYVMAITFLKDFFYFLLGAHYNYGDGSGLRLILQEKTDFFVIGGSFIFICLYYFVGKKIYKNFSRVMPDSHSSKGIFILTIAFLITASVHLGLLHGERYLRQVQTYELALTPDYKRKGEELYNKHLENLTIDQRKLLDESEKEKLLQDFQESLRPWPLRLPLGLLLAISILFGFRATQKSTHQGVTQVISKSQLLYAGLGLGLILAAIRIIKIFE